MKISIDGKRRYAYNVFAERLWRTVKCEEVYLQAYVNAVETRWELGAYFRFYNNLRPRCSTGIRQSGRNSPRIGSVQTDRCWDHMPE